MPLTNQTPSCILFRNPFTRYFNTQEKSSHVNSSQSHEQTPTHSIGIGTHLTHFKDKLCHLFTRFFHVKKNEPVSMANRAEKFPDHLMSQGSKATTLNTLAVKSAQMAEKFQEKTTIVKNVQKGLEEAIQYCKSRDERYGQVENNEIFFHATDIPSLNQLNIVIDYYLTHQREWKGSVHITQEGWPCSIIADQTNAYLLFTLVIGEGGTGKSIYLGMDLSTGENVVIKSLDDQKNKDFDTISVPSYMMNKLNPLFCDDHQGGLLPLKQIINVTSGGIRKQFIVQKLCKQGNLHLLIRSGIDLTHDQKRTIAEDIFKALILLHDHQILHKDLKPENIFLDNGHAYLGDFDYSSSTRSSFRDDSTEAKVNTVGSFPYLAPETVLQGEYDTKSETWGLGLIFYFLFSGEQPKIVQELGRRGSDFKYSAARFNLWNPWAKANPENQGAELVSKMLCTEPTDRIDLKSAHSEFLKIPKKALSFTSPTDNQGRA